jgi:hypothetical protein
MRWSFGAPRYIPVPKPTAICAWAACENVCKRSDAQFCSRECARRARLGVVPAQPRTCESCGREFTPRASTGPYAAPRACSKACGQRIRRAGIEGPRRAVKTGVAARDNWVCQICFVPVDPALRFPDRMSASVDHIVLVTNGGTNDLGNLRLTHLGCNMDRGGWTERGRYAGGAGVA